MKKAFESGKIWTILSAFIFVMMCGLVVLATVDYGQGPSRSENWFYRFRTTSSMGNILTTGDWNILMSGLETMVLPKGAIMAFDGVSRCPNGWKPYDKANDRFLMGAESGIGTTGGSSTVKLTVMNIPAHTHLYKDTIYAEKNINGVPPEQRSTLFELGTIPSGYGKTTVVGNAYGLDDDNYPIQGLRATKESICRLSEYKFLDLRGDSFQTNYCNYSPTPVDIENPHVKVRYCIKD